jgi:type II secretory pathway pseudopilin PulG
VKRELQSGLAKLLRVVDPRCGRTKLCLQRSAALRAAATPEAQGTGILSTVFCLGELLRVTDARSDCQEQRGVAAVVVRGSASRSNAHKSSRFQFISNAPGLAELLRVADPRSARQGYSVIEFVGVLAVLSVLALVLVEVFIKHADIAAVKAETAALNSISNAVVLEVLRGGQIPGATTWAAAAGNYLALPPASVATNSRNYARAYLIDPGGWFGSNALPYTQNAGGTWISNSANLMIVSSLSANLPVTNGMPTAASFSAIWNTAAGNIPTTWAGWTGRADDLLIQRLNLQSLFYQLILVNRDATSTAFSVNGSAATVVTGQSISNAFYLAGSVICLLNTNSGTTATQTVYVLNRNISLVFEHGIWGVTIAGGSSPLPAGSAPGASTNDALFTAISKAFLAATNSTYNSGTSGTGEDQEQVLTAMNYFMTIYTLWADIPGDPFSVHTLTGQGQQDSHLGDMIILNDATNFLGTASHSLLH